MQADDTVLWPSLDQARSVLEDSDGSGIKIAVIDSGIETSHPDLGGLQLEDDLVISCDGISLRIEEGNGVDVYGHGTAVASLVKKIAPGAGIGSFRALDSSNHARSFVIAECVNQAIARGYQIINCSFGCRGLPRYVMDYKEWVDEAYLKGVQVVAACSNIAGGIREWPAYFPSVIAVRGIDCDEDEFFYRQGSMVSILARGERVEVPWLKGDRKIETGSSYAAPLIAGRIARLLSGFPSIDPATVKPLIAALAKPEAVR